MKILSGKILDRAFETVIWLKSLFGIFEILAGLFIATAGERLLDNFLIDLALNEIARDPYDFFARRFIYISVDIYIGAQVFAIIYLIAHGVINIFLAVSLISAKGGSAFGGKNKIWAYPWAMGGFGIFIVYQLYKYFHTLSSSLLLLTAFDVFIVLLIWLEYKRKLKKLSGGHG